MLSFFISTPLRSCDPFSHPANQISSEKSRIPWLDIVDEILDLPCDVLVVLDCCYAGAFVHNRKARKPFRAQNRGFIKEILCSAGFETSASFGKRYSLSPLLSKTLDDFRRRGGLDFSHLFHELCYKMKRYYKRYWRTSNNPVHQRLIEGRPGSIRLHPLPDPTSAPTKKRPASLAFSHCENEPPKRQRNFATFEPKQ